MKNTLLTALIRPLLLLVLLSVATVAPVLAGGQLIALDFTGFPDDLPPGPFPDSSAIGVATLQWDPRCAPVDYQFNIAVIPANAVPPLDAAAARAVFEAAFQSWNDIPTSFIEMRIVGEINRPGAGPFDISPFDFINEVNFLPTPADGITAFSPSANLPVDSDLLPGEDLDGDGDSDVFDPAVVGVNRCHDVDSDGDIEFPAGFYKSGTILENDVAFNRAAPVWTTGVPDSVFANLDLQGVATHEFGHSHGLSHVAVNQLSPTDGTTPTMVNGVSSGDGAGELALRSLSSDDVAWSSYVYPEGSAASGPAALQAGDVAFDDVYGVITGEVFQGELDLPLVGGIVFAIDEDSREIVGSHFTGEVRYAYVDSSLQIFPELPEFHLVHGRYTLPLPAGDYYLGVEALDGAPNFTSALTLTTIVSGNFPALHTFNEELLVKGNGNKLKPQKFKVKAGRTVDDVDHITSVDVNLDSFDTVGLNAFIDWDGRGFTTSPGGTIYAVGIPAAEITDLLDAGLLVKGAAFRNILFEPSTVSLFARASLVPGAIDNGIATLDLDDPLIEESVFVGQDNDYSPFYFEKPKKVSKDIEKAIRHDDASHFFLVLQLTDTFQGALGLPPLIGLDAGQEIGLLGRSFTSTDGGDTFVQSPNTNFMFRLIFGDLD